MPTYRFEFFKWPEDSEEKNWLEAMTVDSLASVNEYLEMFNGTHHVPCPVTKFRCTADRRYYFREVTDEDFPVGVVVRMGRMRMHLSFNRPPGFLNYGNQHSFTIERLY